jgi:hypothetical protein
MWSSYAYGSLELNARTILDGTSYVLNGDAGAIVTPGRLLAWSAITAEILRTTGLDMTCG